MSVRRANLFRVNRRLSSVLGALLAAGLVISSAPGAWAEDTPTSMELLEKCGDGSDYCEFHISGPANYYWAKADLAGQAANCTDADQLASITWEKSTSTTNSFGTSLKVLAGATKAFQVGFKIAYQYDWTETLTDRDTTSLVIPAGHMGRVYHAREMQETSGKYELHFGSRYYGHYFWYLPMTVNSPRTGGNDAVTTQSKPMNDEERATYC